MIKVLKLVNGDDVIADVEVLKEENKISLKNPQRFVMTQEGLGSIPLMPFSSDQTFLVSADHVLFMAEPDVDVKNGYNAQHGSGIVVATGGRLMK